MKIIQQGIDPQTKPVQVQCRNCKSLIEFLPSEATVTSDQRDGDFYQIKCPVCNSTITKNVYAGYNGPG